MKLAELSIGVDDAYNGCWLPRNTRHSGQQPYPKAIPHSRIHRYNYYIWLNIRFKGVKTQNAMIERLRMTRNDLHSRGFPDSVMLKKGQWKTPYDNLPPA